MPRVQDRLMTVPPDASDGWSDLDDTKTRAKLYEVLTEASTAGLLFHQQLLVRRCNRPFAAMFGFNEPDELRDFPILDLVAPSSRGKVLSNVQNQVEEPYEGIGVRRNGSTFPARVWGKNWTAADGSVFGRVAEVRDLSDWREVTTTLDRGFVHAINAVRETLELHDAYTSGHDQSVAELATAIAVHLGLPPDQTESIRIAALLHDVGKIGVPASILARPTKLSDAEVAIVQSHVQSGSKIVSVIESPWRLDEIVAGHHERLDGSGYPKGLREDAISLESRVLAVADVYEAMTAHRPYRPARSHQEAVDELMKGSGVIYDAHVVRACLDVLRDGFTFSLREKPVADA